MELEGITYTKFLYNKTFGSFRLSDYFITTFYQKYNENLNNQPSNSIALRSDPRVIKLFEEIEPPHRCYDKDSIGITFIPTELLKYANILGYNGRESIRVNFDLAYRDILDNIMDNRNLSGLDISKYIRLQRIEQKYLHAIETEQID